MRAAPKAFVLVLSLLHANPALGVAEGDMAPGFMLPVLGGETTKSLSPVFDTCSYISAGNRR